MIFFGPLEHCLAHHRNGSTHPEGGQASPMTGLPARLAPGGWDGVGGFGLKLLFLSGSRNRKACVALTAYGSFQGMCSVER